MEYAHFLGNFLLIAYISPFATHFMRSYRSAIGITDAKAIVMHSWLGITYWRKLIGFRSNNQTTTVTPVPVGHASRVFSQREIEHLRKRSVDVDAPVCGYLTCRS
jgi:hypothetical protein